MDALDSALGDSGATCPASDGCWSPSGGSGARTAGEVEFPSPLRSEAWRSTLPELSSGDGFGTGRTDQSIMTSGSPRCPCATIVASNSIQSPGFNKATSAFRSSPKRSAKSGRSRRLGYREGCICTLTMLLARKNSTSKPSLIRRTSPCHVNVRLWYFSWNCRDVEARCCKVVRGPQSDKKSSHVNKAASPFVISCGMFKGVYVRKTYAPRTKLINPMAIITYFRASTTAQPPTLHVMTSVRKVGRLMRDFLAITFRQRGQW
mmetsp:Transcript_86416/g.241764  ORF Transcript_86416/g.241764 Transcript_86416/m.241764 type:complete len:262 (+) Transcript_86416:67-852(+)